MMTREHRQEAFSLACIQAVAAASGMTHSFTSKDYGIDLALHEVWEEAGKYFETGLRLDVQLKSTTSSVMSRKSIGYDLSLKTYDVLRYPSLVRRVLVLLVLPEDEREWIKQSQHKTELRKCLYWSSIRGHPAVKNRSSIRISIPRHQVFTPASLRWIMDRIRSGEDLT